MLPVINQAKGYIKVTDADHPLYRKVLPVVEEYEDGIITVTSEALRFFHSITWDLFPGEYRYLSLGDKYLDDETLEEILENVINRLELLYEDTGESPYNSDKEVINFTSISNAKLEEAIETVVAVFYEYIN